MGFITSDTLRDISVKTVEDFLNNKIPLSQGLAKHASALELNSDQIQRAIEATNSIAVLKVVSLSDDRTVEFPLCKYAEVMSEIAVPTITLQKTAAMGKTVYQIEKTAAVITEASTGLTQAEQEVYFIKLAAINESELAALRDRAETIVPQLMKAASAVKADEQGLEKLATVADGQVYAMASALVYGSVKQHNDTGLFKAAELKQAEQVIYLLKEAQEIDKAIKEKTELSERCDMIKQAFLGTIGRGIGKAVGSVIAAPFKAVAGAAGRTASNMGNAAADSVRGVMGKPKINAPVKKLGLGAGLGAAAAVGADAMLYSPGRDKTTGRSKDVWTSLQKEV